MAKKDNNFMVSVDPSKVLYTSINTSKEDYNSARMVVKVEDKEYLSISYEWQGPKIPGFAMDLMSFMRSNSVETSGLWEGKEEDYKEFSCRTCDEHKEDKK